MNARRALRELARDGGGRAHAPRACMHIRTPSRVWHVNGMCMHRWPSATSSRAPSGGACAPRCRCTGDRDLPALSLPFSRLPPPFSRLPFSLLAPSFSLLTPSHAFSRLLTPSHAFSPPLLVPAPQAALATLHLPTTAALSREELAALDDILAHKVPELRRLTSHASSSS